MVIRVEFFGIPRHRAGVASAVLPITGPASLGTVMGRLAAEFPDFAAECLQDQQLRSSYVANIDGQQFVNRRIDITQVDSRLRRRLLESFQNLVDFIDN